MMANSRNSGVVLPVVMWFVLAIVSIVATASTTTIMSIKTADNIRTGVLKKYATESAVYKGVYHLHSMFLYNRRPQEILTMVSTTNGFDTVINIIPEQIKMDINQLDEDDIDRVIQLLQQQAGNTEDITTMLGLIGSRITHQPTASYRAPRRYQSVGDIDRRGWQAGLQKELSKYMTIYRNTGAVYSIYVSDDDKVSGADNDELSVYVNMNNSVSEPYRVLEWKS